MPRTDSDGAASILIVGAGAAGLSAGAALKQKGLEPTILDKDDRIGGSWARRYERLHLHTIRRFSGLAHFPIPSAYPRYVHKDAYARYLEDYARTFQLRIELNQRVQTIRPVDGKLWQTVSEGGERWRTRVVIIATGHYNEPVVPRWAGTDDFAGRILHSSEYVSGREFAGQAVLVVGIGNSGAEIAADLLEQGGSRVAIAVRTPPPIMPRDLFGVLPVQLLGIALTPIPAPRLLDRAGAATRRVAIGDLSKYGLGRAEWGPFTARRPAVIDVGFLQQLKALKIDVRPALDCFSPSGVVFVDGREEAFDAVVLATGFNSGLSRMLDVPDAVDESGRPRYRSGRPTPHPGLYFIGFDETTRGVLFEANRDSKRLAGAVRRYLDTSAMPA
jgi:cation diffusion facilitator CzcD-associated flavoprotein CzcO